MDVNRIVDQKIIENKRKMTFYNKLVRDKIPEIIAAKGGVSKTHIASEAEYMQKLEEKLGEEVAEYLESKNPEELADICEVVYALGELRSLSPSELEALRKKKVDERGGFMKKIILEES